MKTAAIRVVLFAIVSWVLGCGGGAPGVETTMGEQGGTLELGSVSLTVPGGFLPEPVTVSIKQRSSLQGVLERDFGAAEYTAVGPAYELTFPFCAPVPIGLKMSYERADLPPGYAASNLAVFIYSDVFYERDPGSTTEPEDLEWTGLFFLPTEVDEEASMARANLSCAATVQLVAMADAAKVVPVWVPVTETATQSNVLRPKLEVPDDLFIIVMLPEIAEALDDEDEEQVFTELRAGLTTAYGTLAGTKGFPAPPLGAMTITATKLPEGLLGRVMPKYPTIIEVDPLQADRLTQSTVAHELFHTIQNWNTNPASILQYFLDDRWFKEGSAEWARDEVFERMADHYQAPTAERFTIPLNKESAGGAVAGEDFLYETVVFWKWLEARYPQTVLSMVRRQRELTHECHPDDPARCIHKNDAVNYIDELQGILQGLAGFDFVEFFVDSLYWKNFDEDETDPGDLWANLGAPQDVQFKFFGRDGPIELSKGGDGDGLDNAKVVDYSVTPHLTADAILVTNAASPLALSGELHVKFRPSSSLTDLVGIVILRDSTKENRVTGLDTEKEVTVSFGPGSEVAIILVDPKFGAPSSAGLAGVLSLWVEPEDIPTTPWPTPPVIDYRRDSATATVEFYNWYQKECGTSYVPYPPGGPPASTTQVTTGCITAAAGDVQDDRTYQEIDPPYYEGPFDASWSFVAPTGSEKSGAVEASSQTSVEITETELVISGSFSTNATATSTEGDQGQAVANVFQSVHFKVPAAEYEFTWGCNLTYVRWYANIGTGFNSIVWQGRDGDPLAKVETCEPITGTLPGDDYWLEIQAYSAVGWYYSEPEAQTRAGSFRLVLRPL